MLKKKPTAAHRDGGYSDQRENREVFLGSTFMCSDDAVLQISEPVHTTFGENKLHDA